MPDTLSLKEKKLTSACGFRDFSPRSAKGKNTIAKGPGSKVLTLCESRSRERGGRREPQPAETSPHGSARGSVQPPSDAHLGTQKTSVGDNLAPTLAGCQQGQPRGEDEYLHAPGPGDFSSWCAQVNARGCSPTHLRSRRQGGILPNASNLRQSCFEA